MQGGQNSRNQKLLEESVNLLSVLRCQYPEYAWDRGNINNQHNISSYILTEFIPFYL